MPRHTATPSGDTTANEEEQRRDTEIVRFAMDAQQNSRFQRMLSMTVSRIGITGDVDERGLEVLKLEKLLRLCPGFMLWMGIRNWDEEEKLGLDEGARDENGIVDYGSEMMRLILRFWRHVARQVSVDQEAGAKAGEEVGVKAGEEAGEEAGAKAEQLQAEQLQAKQQPGAKMGAVGVGRALEEEKRQERDAARQLPADEQPGVKMGAVGVGRALEEEKRQERDAARQLPADEQPGVKQPGVKQPGVMGAAAANFDSRATEFDSIFVDTGPIGVVDGWCIFLQYPSVPCAYRQAYAHVYRELITDARER
ncbi:hypothetical protein T484DRAFT_1852069 [Baffinella frigidus]|nr:hypothetical protein T484DRAFT_1852069 [Cryptophyta sp. CCMP2293]